jgi:DHA2 family multidrug resistance protein
MAVNDRNSASDYAEYAGPIRWVILVSVMLGTIMEVLDVSIVNVAIPDMMGNLGATLDQIGWVSTGYIIANVIVLPLTGWLSARFGRRKYLAASMMLFTAASFFCGTSRSLNELIFFRVLQGTGGAALISTAQATLMEVFPPQQLGMIQGIYGIGVIVAPTVGPTLGGWITDTYTWPWIFFVNIPIGIVATTLVLLFLRDSRYHQAGRRKVDAVGIGFLAIGLGSLQTVLERGNREDWFDSQMIVWLTVTAVVFLVLFVWWELRTPEPAVNLHILRNRGFTAGTVFALAVGFGLYGGVFILPVFLQDLRHYTAEQTGLIFLPGGLATMFVTPIVGRMVNRIPPRILAGVGAVLFAVSMYMLHFLTMDTGPEHLFWPLVLRGAALGWIFIPLSLATLLGLAGRELAYGTGLFNLARQLGGSAGIAFLSTFLDRRTVLHNARLLEHITPYSAAATIRIKALEAGFISRGSMPAIAHKQALAAIQGTVYGQASVMAFNDAFLVICFAFLGVLPLLLFFNKGLPVGIRGGATMD